MSIRSLQYRTAFLRTPAGNYGKKLCKALAVLSMIAAGLVFSAPSATAQGEVKATHGDWQMRCDTPPGAAGEQCALIQNVTAEDRENVGLSVIVLKTADHVGIGEFHRDSEVCRSSS